MGLRKPSEREEEVKGNRNRDIDQNSLMRGHQGERSKEKENTGQRSG